MRFGCVKEPIWSLDTKIKKWHRRMLVNIWTKRIAREQVLDLTSLTTNETRRLNEIAEEIKSDYTKFVDEFTRDNSDYRYVWAIPLVSRNIHNDDLFIELTRLFLVKEAVASRDIKVILCGSKEMYLTLIKIVPRSIEVRCLNDDKGTSRFIVWNETRRFLDAEVKISKYEASKPLFKDKVSLVLTPCLSSGFSNNYYTDRYFGNLTHYTSEDVRYISSLTNNVGLSEDEFARRLVECENVKFILGHLYLQDDDFKKIKLYQKKCRALMRQTYLFEDNDITYLVRKSLERGLLNKSALKGIIFERILLRLKLSHVDIDRFIVWYEAKPFDLMAVASIRELYPESKCIAYEGYPIDEMDLGLYISEYQYESNHAPTKMAIPGKAYREDAIQFCNKIETLDVPIARNDYILRKARVDNKLVKDILIVLPYFEDAARVIIEGVNLFIENSKKPYNVYVKNHPVYENYKIEDYGVYNISFVPSYVSGKLNDCLEGKNVVVTSSTSATLEVLFYGIPLIIICPSGQLKFTGLPDKVVESMFSLVYDENELRESLEYYMSEDFVVDNSKLSDLIVDKNEETMRRIWQ